MLSRILFPVARREWSPSQTVGWRTRFRITARLDDGHIAWRRWYDDREEADADLWNYIIGDAPGLRYDFATVTFLTTPTGSNQTWTSPSDWNNSANTIECVGGGGSGSSSYGSATNNANGGGGASYNRTKQFQVATPGTTTATYQIAAGGTAVTRNTAGNTNGNAGGVTWFNDTVDPGFGFSALKCAARPGGGGVAGASSTTNNSGDGSSGWYNDTNKSGGSGGGGSNTTANNAGGGGGPGGPVGAGNQGGVSAGSGATTGGQADLTTGGTGGSGASGTGARTGSAGNSGAEWTSKGCGGGGGGGRTTSAAATATGGLGGAQGGGGGGAIASSATATSAVSGVGGAGIIVITYTLPTTYPQLERGTRGLNRGIAGAF